MDGEMVAEPEPEQALPVPARDRLRRSGLRLPGEAAPAAAVLIKADGGWGRERGTRGLDAEDRNLWRFRELWGFVCLFYFYLGFLGFFFTSSSLPSLVPRLYPHSRDTGFAANSHTNPGKR